MAAPPARSWPPKPRDSGTVKEFIDEFRRCLDLKCGTAEGAVPQKEKLINVFLRGSLRPGGTALSETETIRRRVMEGESGTPKKVPFIPIFSHDLAVSFPCPSRAAGQPRSRAENRVSGQSELGRRDAAVVIRHVRGVASSG